jgi:hypothetical protein
MTAREHWMNTLQILLVLRGKIDYEFTMAPLPAISGKSETLDGVKVFSSRTSLPESEKGAGYRYK